MAGEGAGSSCIRHETLVDMFLGTGADTDSQGTDDFWRTCTELKAVAEGHKVVVVTHCCCQGGGYYSALEGYQQINSEGTGVLYMLLGGRRALGLFNRGRDDAD